MGGGGRWEQATRGKELGHRPIKGGIPSLNTPFGLVWFLKITSASLVP